MNMAERYLKKASTETGAVFEGLELRVFSDRSCLDLAQEPPEVHADAVEFLADTIRAEEFPVEMELLRSLPLSDWLDERAIIQLYCDSGLAYPLSAQIVTLMTEEMRRRGFINKEGRLTAKALKTIMRAAERAAQREEIK
jgi:hypothetical protein